MKLLPILALIATPAIAGDPEINWRKCDAPCVVEIVYHNRITISPGDYEERVVTLDTDIGTIHIFNTRRDNPTYDTAEVVDIPANYVAVPNILDLEEETVGFMKIYRYTGM